MAVVASLVAGCVEWAPDAPRADVEGCYGINLAGGAEARLPAPPIAFELTDRALLEPDAPPWRVAHHRFDAHAAHEAYFVYADTTLRVAWWWESEPDGVLGVGNKNQAAAFYVAGVVTGDAFEGEMRRWLYDDEGRPVQGPDAWSVPVTGRSEGCAPS